MEQFKEELKRSNQITAVFCIILAVFSLLGIAGEEGLISLTPVAGDSHWQSMWRGMISGASFGVLAVMVCALIRGIQALRDEKALKKLYVEANDERQIQICTSARASAMQITLLAGLVVGLIIGYFNITVSVTILALETVHALISFGCKLYYSRKY